MNLNIIGRKGIFLGIAGLSIVAAVALIAAFGLREGIDFSGGTLWRIKVPDADIGRIEETLRTDLNAADARVSFDSRNGSYLIRLGALGEEEHRRFLQAMQADFGAVEELSFQSIGPSVGAELRQKSLLAILFVLLGISFYIAYAFRQVSRPVASWKYGVVTLVTLFHDVLIPAGVIALLGHYGRAEVDSNFVVALLVVMGFSVHDTIVVFDRIRENLSLDRGRSDFGQVVNASVNQSMARSVNTSLTLILVLLAMYFVGPEPLRYFILTLLVGVVTGIYSSIFVASPLLHLWQGWAGRGRK